MVHDPIAAKALLLFLGCPEAEVDRVFGDYTVFKMSSMVPDRFVDLMDGLREAMRGHGHEPTS